MPSRSELLGKPVDPIGDVCHRFEDVFTDSYSNPYNGDLLSDDYYRIIDLSTQPSKLSENALNQLQRSIVRMNRMYVHTQARLEVDGLDVVYDDVAQQINTINLANGNADNVPLMVHAELNQPQ